MQGTNVVTPAEKSLHIAWLELSAVLHPRSQDSGASLGWLVGVRVLVRCDNTQAVAAIISTTHGGSTRVREGQWVSRHLAELAIHY